MRRQNLDINQIINDGKGNLWIGTEADGIFHYSVYSKKFNTLKLAIKEYPLKNKISKLLELTRGKQ